MGNVKFLELVYKSVKVSPLIILIGFLRFVEYYFRENTQTCWLMWQRDIATEPCVPNLHQIVASFPEIKQRKQSISS